MVRVAAVGNHRDFELEHMDCTQSVVAGTAAVVVVAHRNYRSQRVVHQIHFVHFGIHFDNRLVVAGSQFVVVGIAAVVAHKGLGNLRVNLWVVGASD